MNYHQRTKIIAGNWKMYKNKNEALKFIQKINVLIPDATKVETMLFAQATLLDILVQNQGPNLKIGAQNMFYENEGPFTGEISPLNLKSLGVQCVLLGHNERREYFQETDQLINKKLLLALQNDLHPILCLGETLTIREQNKTKLFLEQQLTQILQGVSLESMDKITIAYEPIWAIGAGKSASPADANNTIKQIRNKIASLYSKQTSETVRIIYGGSVSPANILNILKQKEIDGILAGKSALKPENFLYFVTTTLQYSIPHSQTLHNEK
ncbi:triose-phosphate isomerase ['Fragaria x ananassa' phyllody phytoplasma]|uniref:Triosephosphate isomerase n=1 Tax='Fragaria x ananassa' phyllody phytoplasma TaxID=2358428 RepID=A0ABS5K540_9MOLU|nr:triose-phosphate isomerase ['Fragaria x ananassa' phyllody phytoplasma]MBS2126485.1 triose-phosphate isomerase ['Fragaria x ananassa' phyllody phytoplasma]